MDEYSNKYLYDILSAIEDVESYFRNRPKEFDGFCKDSMLHKAIERNIEIIGEATSRLLKINEDIPISNARQAVNARNFIIHGYDKVDDTILWGIVINDLPKLKTEIQTLL